MMGAKGGRQETPQSVKDALADAETWRVNVLGSYFVTAAGKDAAMSALTNTAFCAAMYAHAAARAAFRAVPGLRGDR